MIAKYNGFCKVTKQQIVAGVTEIQKINGIWQVVGDTQPPHGITTAMAIVTTPKGHEMLVRTEKLLATYPDGYKVEPDNRPAYNRGDIELDEQFWRRDA